MAGTRHGPMLAEVHEAIRPELVCEVSCDRMQGPRFRHGSTFVRRRPDRRPETCIFEQVAPPKR